MDTKLTTFKLPKELHQKLKEIALREGRDMTDIVIEEITDYIKVHGEGNPVYKLDEWTNNPQFIAIPAMLSPFEFWKKWFIHNQNNPKLIREIQYKTQELDGLVKKWDTGRLPKS